MRAANTALFRKLGESGIFQVPTAGGEEKRLIDTNGPFLLWDVYDKGICYVETPAGEKPIVMCYELATGSNRKVPVLEKLPRWGLPSPPTGSGSSTDQEDVTGSDLVLVENSR